MTIFGTHYNFNDAWLAWLYIGGCVLVIWVIIAVVCRTVDDLFGK
jgi:hypothetical protein